MWFDIKQTSYSCPTTLTLLLRQCSQRRPENVKIGRNENIVSTLLDVLPIRPRFTCLLFYSVRFIDLLALARSPSIFLFSFLLNTNTGIGASSHTTFRIMHWTLYKYLTFEHVYFIFCLLIYLLLFLVLYIKHLLAFALRLVPGLGLCTEPLTNI